MSFVVQSVHLENFRTHESLDFSPNEKGVTVIKGENGTGKSSLIDAIAWCIYGIKPNGVAKNTDLRRHHMDLDTEKTSVKVNIKLPDSSEYEIERRILGKKGSAECDVRQIVRNGNSVSKEHVAGASVTHATEFILRIIGVNEKGFLASMFVQQKQVDELLTASPKDRSAVIEKMTGITALTEAVADIRADLRDAKKTMELYGNDSQDYNIEEIKSGIEEKSKNLQSLEKEYDKTVEKGKLLKKEFLELQEIHKHQSEVLTKLDKQNAVYGLVSNEYENLKESLGETEKRLKEKEDSLAKLEGSLQGKSAEEVLDEYNKKNSELSNVSYTLENLNKETPFLQDSVNEGVNLCAYLYKQGLISTELSGDLTSQYVASAVKELKEVQSDLLNNKDKLSGEIKDLNESISQKDFMYTSNVKVIAALSNEEGECPTCHQKPANLKELLDGLHKTNDSLSKEKQDLENEKNKLSGELDSIVVNIANIDSNLETLATAEQSSVELFEKNEKIKSLESQKNKLSVEVEDMQELYSLVNNVYSVQKDVNNVRIELANIADRVKEKESKKKELLAEKKALEQEAEGFSGFEERQDNIDSMSQTLDVLRTKVSDIKIEKNSLHNAIEYDNKTLSQAEASKERYEKSVNTYEKIASSSKIVSGFRENLIEEVVPEISLKASALLQKFTDGKFVGIYLDKSYKAQVEQADGVRIDVGLLSGGELSAVALSLRLAIAMISHKGESVSTMILDEVLVSQDESRVENIVNTIKESLDGQVILIGHNGDVISSIADKIVELG